MAVAMIGPKFYAWDRNGKPLAFGKLYTYQARTNTPKPTYQSEDQVVENTNPVILNGEGYANVYLDGSYKMVLKDDKDNEIWSSDPVSAAQPDEWVKCMSSTYVSPLLFRVGGNLTEDFQIGRRCRIDNNSTEYSYSTIKSSTFSGGQTTVELFDAVVTTGIVGACVSIVGPDTLDYDKAMVTANGSTEPRTLSDRFGDSFHVKDFGVIGDGTTDDSDAVSAAIQSSIDNDRVLDLGSGEYLITRELAFSVTSKRLRITGTSAVLKYSPAAHTQNFFTINANQSTVDIGRGVEFDGQQNANVVVYINSLDDVESLDEASNVYFEGVVRNAYRVIDFVRGAGLHISGGFSNVFFDGAAYNCRAAVGAIITGSQAIRGVLVGSNGANQYPISVVFGDNSVISGVGSDDLTINNDQDGIYVATPVQSNIDTTLVVSRGATFQGCRGRSIKAKVDNAVVSGLYIIDEGDGGGTVQSVIDLQYGGSYKDCIVRCQGVAPGSIFSSGGLEYPSTVRATEVLVKDCYIWSDVPLTTIVTSFPRGEYVGDVKIRDISVRAEVSRFFDANLNNGDRKDSVSGVTIDNLTGELIRCMASGGDSPYKGVFTVSDCTNKTPASSPLVIRSGISGQSADGWANAENMDGFAPSTSAYRRLSGAGEEVPYGKSMSPMLAQRTIDGVVNLSVDSGAFFGETTSLTENQEFTLTSRGRGTSPQGLYFLTVANINGAGLMDFVFITGTSITSLGGGAIGSDFAYGAGSDPAVNAKINVWVDAATGSLKVISRQSGTTRQLTIWSMT